MKLRLIIVILALPSIALCQSCFFSRSGDTVLFIKNAFIADKGDTSKNDYTFYVRSKQAMPAVQVKTSSRWTANSKYYQEAYDSVKKYSLMDESEQMDEEDRK